MSLFMRYAARSHVGRVREGNEDSAYAGPHLLVLADGMGGHAAGEVASAAAITAFTPVDTDDVADPAARLVQAVVEADQRLREKVADDAAREGMGTTLTALYWDGAAFTLAHIGDSRAYLLREGSLRQISHDHTFVQTLVDEGRITAEEAHAHPQRSLILRALDGRGRAEPDIERFEAQEGDRYLVCSDGLSDYVAYAAIVSGVQLGSLEAAADRLVELALAAGAPDNVTVLLADIVESDETGVIPLSDPDDHLLGPGVLVGAIAEDEAQRAAAAASAVGSTERPDRRLHDPEDDNEESQAEALRYAPQEPSRWRWFRVAAILVVVAGVLTGLGYAGYGWTRTQYYVGVDHDQVAIFQGIEQRIVGQPLSEVYEVYEVPVEQLPTFDRSRVEESIQATSLDNAKSIADRIATRAAACERFREQAAEAEEEETDPTTSPSPSPSPSATESAGPGQTTQPGQTTRPGQTRPGATTAGAPGATTTAGGPVATTDPSSTDPSTSDPATSDPSASASETTAEVTTEPEEEPGDEEFDEPVTREECGVTGS